MPQRFRAEKLFGPAASLESRGASLLCGPEPTREALAIRERFDPARACAPRIVQW
jgi:hypothetical protein